MQTTPASILVCNITYILYYVVFLGKQWIYNKISEHVFYGQYKKIYRSDSLRVHLTDYIIALTRLTTQIFYCQPCDAAKF